MKDALTDRQKQVLNLIQSNMRILPPTLEMLAKLCGIKKQSIYDVVQALKKKGFLDKSGLPVEVSDNFVTKNGWGETIFDSTRCNINYYGETFINGG